jgi:putative ABC transport system permease protein
MTDIIKIAFRNLLRYKRRTLLTSLLITVGLVAVLLYIAVYGSFKSSVVAQFTDSMVGHMQVHRRGYIGAMESLPVDRNMRPRMLVKLYEVLDSTPAIEAWSPRIKLMAMFSNFASTTSIRVNGVYPEREDATVPLAKTRVMEPGEVTPLVRRGYIQVPELLAKPMQLKVGDTVVLVATNKDGSVNGKTFVIQGILASISGPGGRDGYIHIDDARELLRIKDEGVEPEVLAEHGLVELEEKPSTAPSPLKLKQPAEPQEAAPPAVEGAPDLPGDGAPEERQQYIDETRTLFDQQGWGRPAEVSEIAIRLQDMAMLDDTLADLEARVSDLKNRKGLSIFQLHAWEKFVPFAKVAKLIDYISVFIKVILVSVVLFSIMNVLIMAVYERVREIGTISAIGTRPTTVLGLFLSEGFLLGLVGTLIGIAISLVLVYLLNLWTINMPFGRQEINIIQPTLTVWEVVSTGILTILVAVLASFQPAWKASRMDPITALRHI